jgi:hypothetical protein
MNDSLDSMTDAQLSEVFAVEVANIPHLFTLMNRGLYYRVNAAGYTSRLEEAWKVTEDVADKHVYPHDEPVSKHRLPYPPFATSADAVLPWLEKCEHTFPCDEERISVSRYRATWGVAIAAPSWDDSPFSASAATFPRAACLALIRAKRGAK